MGRATQGVRLLTVDAGDVVASAIRTEEEATEAAGPTQAGVKEDGNGEGETG